MFEAEPVHGHADHQLAHAGQDHEQAADIAASRLGLEELLEADDRRDDADDDVKAVLGDPVGGVNHKLGDGGELGVHVLEHLGKRRDDHPEHEHDGDHRHEDQDHRIHQRGLDLALGFARIANLLVELDQDQGHLAGDLAGADGLDPLELEMLGKSRGRCVEGATGGHLGGDLLQDGPELDALALRGRDLQRLEQGRPRVDQRGELVEEREGVFQLGLLVRFL